MTYEYDILLADGRVRRVRSVHCPDRHTSTYLRGALSQELVRKGEQTPMQAFSFTNVVL